MLLRPEPCCSPLLLLLLSMLLAPLLLGPSPAAGAPATRSPGSGSGRSSRRRSTTASPPRSTTAPICVDTTPAATPAATSAPTTSTLPPWPSTSMAATNSTWPRQWVGPDLPHGSAPARPGNPNVVLPPGVAGGGSVKDNLIEDEEDGVTCYTCVNVSDNMVCNKYAIDVPCPRGEDFCHTLHIVDSRGESVLVNKKCADASECDPEVLGCLHIDTQTVCASCCDESYCNETVPTNRTASFFSSTRPRPTSPPTLRSRSSSSVTSLSGQCVSAAGAIALWLMWGH